MKKIDMHVHTTASDGCLTPEGVIDYAMEKGLFGLAITDHDTIDGIETALDYARYNKLLVIPGIELSTELNEEEIHILGYNIDYNSKILLNLLNTLKYERENRASKIINRLRDLNIDITLEEVMVNSKEGVIGRPHIAKVLMNKGYVEDIASAFPKYLNKGAVAYVPRYKITPYEAIKLIKEINGTPVIAHPGIIKDKMIIRDLIDNGIEGIEVYHSLHSCQDEDFLYNIAQDFKLLVTGGSDFHYIPSVNDSKVDLGSSYVIYEDVKTILKL